MPLHRDIEPVNPDGDERMELVGGIEERRLVSRSWTLATGTLACPTCDMPVLPDTGVHPGLELACPWCEHAAKARDFFTIMAAPRPTRVAVIATL